MADISGVGISIRLVASNTFPTGITITEFADNADPLDIASLQIADKAMGLNGDLITWAKANPIIMTTNVIPRSDSDINLGILLEANRVGRGKSSVQDVINAVITYPDGETTTLSSGAITDGLVANSVEGAGRKKSKPYIFAFENKTGGG